MGTVITIDFSLSLFIFLWGSEFPVECLVAKVRMRRCFSTTDSVLQPYATFSSKDLIFGAVRCVSVSAFAQ